MLTRRTVFRMAAFAAILVAANGPVFAETAPLALKGYDPVAYFTDAKPTPGVEQFELLWDGQRYRFASAQHRDMFKANPDKYAPQFGGLCAMNLSNGVKRRVGPAQLGDLQRKSLRLRRGTGNAERHQGAR